MKTKTEITTEAGSSVYLTDKPCTACGCHQAFVFECGCGAIHSDVCYNCGLFVDMTHDPIEVQNEGLDGYAWAGRCTAGHVEHKHTWPFSEGRE